MFKKMMVYLNYLNCNVNTSKIKILNLGCVIHFRYSLLCRFPGYLLS